MKTTRNIAIVMAAGSGSRFGGELPKQFVTLGDKPIVAHSLMLFERSSIIDEIVLVVSESYMMYASQAVVDTYKFGKVRKITAGGETRQESVLAGLSACPSGIDLVAIHDAVRPFLSNELLRDVMAKARETGAAILAVPAKESVKVGQKGFVTRTLKRDSAWIAQTPQVFQFDDILRAHQRAAAARNHATDDAELYEQYCGQVAIVMGSYNNIKITTQTDLAMAQEILRNMA